VQYALVLLDWNLPREDGLSVLKHMRAAGNTTPVLMLTARVELGDRVAGLDGGADDYLVKPFELAELKARMRSLLRRKESRATGALSVGSLVLDPTTHTVQQAGSPVVLTAREFSLLRALMEQPSAVLSRAQLEERLYGWDDAVESNAVEFIIHAVRKKLGAQLIENVRGVGWRLRPDP
jgi:DNA-binding response OmpR family regulator